MKLPNQILRFLKKLFLGLILLIFLGIVVGIFYYDDAKLWALEELEQYISESQSGDLEIERVELALFQNLPDITILLKDISYYEKKDSLRNPEAVPIFKAKELYLGFEPWDLVRYKKLKMTTLEMRQGEVFLVGYKDSTINLENALQVPKEKVIPKPKLIPKDIIRKKKVANESGSITKSPIPQESKITKGVGKSNKDKNIKESDPLLLEVILEEIKFQNIKLVYENRLDEDRIELQCNWLGGNLVLNEPGMLTNINASIEVLESASIPAVSAIGPIDLVLEAQYTAADSLLEVNKGVFTTNELEFALNGKYAHQKDREILMEFEMKSSDIALFTQIVQEEVLKDNRKILENAEVTLKGKFKTNALRKLPVLDLDMGIKNLNMNLPEGLGKFENVGFYGYFHSGLEEDYSKAVFKLQDLQGSLPGGVMDGSLELRNFKKPSIKSDLELSLDLEGYDDIFNLSAIDSLQGHIYIKSNLNGELNLDKVIALGQIGSLEINLKDIGFYLVPTKKSIRDLDLIINAKEEHIELKEIQLNYDKSDIALSGSLENLIPFLFKKNENLRANFSLNANQIFTEDLVPIPDFKPMIKDRLYNMRADLSVNARSIEDSFLELPEMEIKLSNAGFDLDQLPGINRLDTEIFLNPVTNGVHILMKSLDASLPLGSAKGMVDVVITDRARVLDTNAEIAMDNFPLEYVMDLINALNNLELIPSKELSAEDAMLVSGNLDFDGRLQTAPFALSNMNFQHSNLKVKNADDGLYEMKNISLSIDKLTLIRDSLNYNKVTGVDEVAFVSKIDTINLPTIKNIPFYIKVEGTNDIFTSHFTTFSNSEETDVGDFVLNTTTIPATFNLDYQLNNISLAKALEEYSEEQLMDGTLNVNINFNGYMNKLEEAMDHLEGTVGISSDSLTLYGLDLDDLLKKYKRSQNFNLVDISAFLLAGPMGAVVTKGRDFASLLQASRKLGIQTVVPSARANWTYTGGLLNTEDVAFSTPKNRVAFDGVIDIANDSIPEFKVYVIDKKGCSLMEQSVSGSMDSLALGKLNISKTLLGSVINFVDAVVGKDCEVVYDGVVKHPQK